MADQEWEDPPKFDNELHLTAKFGLRLFTQILMMSIGSNSSLTGKWKPETIKNLLSHAKNPLQKQHTSTCKHS